jgi:hypothetical protein
MNHRSSLSAACAAVLVALPACASGGLFGPQPPEPTRIVLRNGTGHDLQEVVIRGGGEGGVERFGSVAPLAAGRDVTFRRPDPLPPTPERVEIQWRERGGAPVTRVLPLREGLQVLAGRTEKTLVLTIGRGGQVSMTLAP